MLDHLPYSLPFRSHALEGDHLTGTAGWRMILLFMQRSGKKIRELNQTNLIRFKRLGLLVINLLQSVILTICEL